MKFNDSLRIVELILSICFCIVSFYFNLIKADLTNGLLCLIIALILQKDK